jgi:D-cysteine desulfhydrase
MIAEAPGRRRQPRLFDALPGLAGRVPWMPLVEGPTPVERCEAIAPWLGCDDVWIKRDDRCSRVYGGNKVRRYEFVLADALERGAKTVVTAGGLASTQVMATALLGARIGLGVQAVLFDQPVTQFARRAMLADVTAGAELIHGGGYGPTALRTVRARLTTPSSYLILPGAAEPLANLGYLDAMLELDEQVRAGQCPRPEAIVLPTGSSGTLAALALGAAWLGWSTEIVGVRITTSLACNRLTIGLIAAETRRFVRRIALPAAARGHRAGLRPPDAGGPGGPPLGRAVAPGPRGDHLYRQGPGGATAVGPRASLPWSAGALLVHALGGRTPHRRGGQGPATTGISPVFRGSHGGLSPPFSTATRRSAPRSLLASSPPMTSIEALDRSA